MNLDKIIDLGFKAGFHVDWEDTDDIDEDGRELEFGFINSDGEVDNDVFVKFAELIIQECVTVCERLQDDTDRQNWPTPYDCVEAIKEHFGIEGEK